MTYVNNDPMALKQLVESRHGIVIRGFRSEAELLDQFKAALAQGQPVAFMPTMSSLRHFYNTEGFIESLTRIISGLDNVEVLAEPALYGNIHMVVVAPAISSSPR